MAIRTQIRLPQITGSLGTGGAQINDQINSGNSVATGSVGNGNLAETLSYMAAAIKRIHGADSFTESAAGAFAQTIDVTGAVTASAGVNVGGDLDVTSDATFGSDVTVTGDMASDTINTTGDVSFGGDAAVSGDINVTGHITGSDFIVTGDLDVGFANTKLAYSNDGVLAEITDVTWDGADLGISNGKGIVVDGGATFNANVTVAGNLSVTGTTTTVDTANLQVEDAVILLGSGSGGESAPGDRGLLMAIGSSERNPAMFWDDSDDEFAFVRTDAEGTDNTITPDEYADLRVKDLNATAVTAELTGSNLTAGRIALSGQGGAIIDDSELLFDLANVALTLGSTQPFTLTHEAANNTATVTTNHRLAFGTADRYIRSDNNDLIAVSNNAFVVDVNEDIVLDSNGASSNGGQVILRDGGIERGKIVMEGTGKNQLILTSSAAFNVVLGAPENIQINIEEQDMGTFQAAPGQFIMSSSNGNAITLDSSAGSIGFVKDGAADGAIVNLNKSNRVVFGNLDTSAGSVSRGFLELRRDGDPHVISGSILHVVNAAGAAGGIRLNTDSADPTQGGVQLSAPDGMSTILTLKLPDADGSNGHVLQTDGSGNLSFAQAGGAANSLKLINEVTTAVSAGNPLSNGVSASSFDLSAVTADQAPNVIDVYVNGQLLQSSSDGYASLGGSSLGDYAIDGVSSTADLKFTFDLEVDDTVTITVRA